MHNIATGIVDNGIAVVIDIVPAIVDVILTSQGAVHIIAIEIPASIDTLTVVEQAQ